MPLLLLLLLLLLLCSSSLSSPLDITFFDDDVVEDDDPCGVKSSTLLLPSHSRLSPFQLFSSSSSPSSIAHPASPLHTRRLLETDCLNIAVLNNDTLKIISSQKSLAYFAASQYRFLESLYWLRQEPYRSHNGHMQGDVEGGARGSTR